MSSVATKKRAEMIPMNNSLNLVSADTFVTTYSNRGSNRHSGRERERKQEEDYGGSFSRQSLPWILLLYPKECQRGKKGPQHPSGTIVDQFRSESVLGMSFG